jgi:hypothetical protein
MTQTTPLPWWVMPGLGAMVLVIFAGAVAASCFVADNTLRTTMFTATITMAAAVIAYYWGSSAGSQKKDDVIAASVPAPPP